MRNRLIHVYFDVTMHIIWRTIEDDLPSLITEIKRILDAEQDQHPRSCGR